MSTHIQAPKKKRYGIYPAKPGTAHIVVCPDGTKRQFDVQERRAMAPDAKTVCICKTCRREWATEAELLQNHDDSALLVKHEESHVYLWAQLETPEPVPAKPGAKVEPPKKPVVVALFSDDDGK